MQMRSFLHTALILLLLLAYAFAQQERIKCPESKDPTCGAYQVINNQCLLFKMMTHDYGETYLCLEEILNQVAKCPGNANYRRCDFSDCDHWDSAIDIKGEARKFYCYDATCPGEKSMVLKTDKSPIYECESPLCDSKFGLKWKFQSNTWKCLEAGTKPCPSEISQDVASNYYCAANADVCANSYLVPYENCHLEDNCFEQDAGWACQKLHSTSLNPIIIAVIVVFALLVLWLVIKAQQKKKLENALKTEKAQSFISNA